MIHSSAIIDFQPISHPSFARKVLQQPSAILRDRVVVGPQAIIYAGCVIDDDTVICPQVHIREGARIGKRCIIGVGVRIGFDVIIGDDCQIMDDTHISGGSIIGNNCFISVQVLMVNDDKPRGYNWKGVTPVKIGNNVVIGAGARLRPGIKVGDYATIGMGAIVTRDVDSGVTVKGFPAKVDEKRYSIDAIGQEMLASMPRKVYPEWIG
jgi:UDP-2-acetamido-3-amino-2,3-dideoxy-glucuronate N-acetyltransferase